MTAPDMSTGPFGPVNSIWEGVKLETWIGSSKVTVKLETL